MFGVKVVIYLRGGIADYFFALHLHTHAGICHHIPCVRLGSLGEFLRYALEIAGLVVNWCNSLA